MAWRRPPSIQVRGTRRGCATPGSTRATPAATRGTPATRPTVRGRPLGPNDPTAPPRHGRWYVKGPQSHPRGHREYKWDPVYKKWYMVDHLGRMHPADSYRRYGQEPPQPCEFYLGEGERLMDPSWPPERRKQWQDHVQYQKYKERVERFEKNIPYDWVPPEEACPRFSSIKIQETPPEERAARRRRELMAKRKALEEARSQRWRGKGVDTLVRKYGKTMDKHIKLMDPAPSGAMRYLKYDPDFKKWTRFNMKNREHPTDRILKWGNELPTYCSPPRDSAGRTVHPKRRTAEQKEQAFRHHKWERWANEVDAWEKDADWGGTDPGDYLERKRARPTVSSPRRSPRSPASPRTPALRPCLKSPAPDGTMTPRRRALAGIQFEYPSCMIIPSDPSMAPYPGDLDYDADRQPSSARRFGSPPPDPESPLEQPPPFMPPPPPPGTPPWSTPHPQDLLTPRVPLACQVWPEQRFEIAQRWGTPRHYEDDAYGPYGPDPFSPPRRRTARQALTPRFQSPGPAATPSLRPCLFTPGTVRTPLGNRGVRFHEQVSIQEFPSRINRAKLKKLGSPYCMRPAGAKTKRFTTSGGQEITLEGARDAAVARSRTPGRPAQKWPKMPGDTPGRTTPRAARQLKRPRMLPQPYKKPNLQQPSRLRQVRQAGLQAMAEAQRRPGITGPGTPLPIRAAGSAPAAEFSTPIQQPVCREAPQTVAVMGAEYAPDPWEKWQDKLEQQRIQASTANYMRPPFIYDAMMPPFFDAHPTVVRYDPRCPPKDTFDYTALAKLDEPEEEIQLSEAPPEPWTLLPKTDPRYWEGNRALTEAIYELSPEHKPFKGHTRPMVPTPPRVIPRERRWHGMPEPFGDEYRRKVWSQRDNLIWNPQTGRWREDPTVTITRIYNPETWFLLDLAYAGQPCEQPPEAPAGPARAWTPPRTPPQPLDVSGEERYTPRTQPPLAINVEIVMMAAEIMNKRIADEQYVQRMEEEQRLLEERLEARKLRELQEQPVPTIGPFDAADWYRRHPGKHHPTLPCPTGCAQFRCPFPMPGTPSQPPPPPPRISPPVDAFARRPDPMSNQNLLRGVFQPDC